MNVKILHEYQCNPSHYTEVLQTVYLFIK